MNTLTIQMGRTSYRPQSATPNSIVGVLIFIVTEIMFFAGLISAFIVVKAGSVWPPPDQPRLPVEATAVNTLVLLASGTAMFFAHRIFTQGRDVEQTKKWLGLAAGLGAFFVVFQGYEWVRLIAFGLTMRSSTYGAFFYLIVGAHAFHVAAALMVLGYCNLQLMRGELTQALFSATQLFWYFVVLLWPLLYTLVYLL